MTGEGVPPAIRAFVETTNSGDSEGFVSAFTDDAHLSDWGREFAGRSGVRDWDATDNIGVQAHFDLLDVTSGPDPETHIATLRVTGNGYNGTGPMTFRLRNGLIADLRIG